MPAPTVNAASQVFLGRKYQRSQKLIYWQTFKGEGKIDFKEGFVSVYSLVCVF